MIGTVAQLWRYPVKSMPGERLAESDVDVRGLSGDRRRAVLDKASGKVASAKNPRLWRDLLTLDPTLAADELSARLGREVSLIDVPPPQPTLDRSKPELVLEQGIEADVAADVIELGSAAPPGTFFDFAPIHLITTSTLDAVTRLGGHTAEVRRYRPNLVVAAGEEDFAENDWPGATLRIGTEVVLRVIAATPRCSVPTLAHGDLPRDADALRVLAAYNRIAALPGRTPEPCAGVYAQVLQAGHIREGDPCHLDRS